MQIPQILQQLAGNQPAASQIIARVKQAKSLLGAVQNPQAELNRILQQNPQVMQIVQQYGSIDGAITALCQQKGINPQEIMDALK